jgi:double zinc ribbon protein
MSFINSNPATNDPQGREESELQMVPPWSIVLAVLVFSAVQYMFFVMMPHKHSDSFVFKLLPSFAWGAALASYILLVGYVSRDVKRRNMSAKVWMLIILLLPGNGAVVYFLLRQPIQMACPGCHSQINSSYNFCPQCHYQLAPTCGICHRSVRTTDIFCTQCGHDLAEDHTPARLRA